MSSRQNPLHVTSCDCYCYRFWGGLSLSRVCGYQHIRDPTWSQKPILNRLGNASRSCFVGFRWLDNNSCSFHVAFICMHVPQCFFHLRAYSFHFAFISRHVPFMCINFLHFPFIYSFRIHSNVHSCPFIFLSSSLQFACMVLSYLSFCIHILWFPF